MITLQDDSEHALVAPFLVRKGLDVRLERIELCVQRSGS
jgi:hypothetical protein